MDSLTGLLLVTAMTSGPADRAPFANRADDAGRSMATIGTRPAVDSIRINPFVWFDAARKTVHLTLIGGHEGVNGGMNFNGADRGAATLTVPLGWRVSATFRNRDAALPHSVIIVPAVTPVPVVAGEAAFPGAVSATPVDGVTEGEESHFAFTAAREGEYLILCAVPGHGTAGMWIGLSISASATRPAYR